MFEHDERNAHQPGDKVRIRMGPHKGSRGIIHSVAASGLLVKLNDGDAIYLPASGITNFSLAARRAWQSMPKRAGRPATKIGQKRMVSIRIEQDSWEQLGRAVDLGLIRSREQSINEWIRDNLSKLRELNQQIDWEVPNGRLDDQEL